MYARPHVPVDKFDRTHHHRLQRTYLSPSPARSCLRQTTVPQSSTHAGSKSISCVPPSGVRVCSNGCRPLRHGFIAGQQLFCPVNGSVATVFDSQLRPLVSFRTPHVTFPVNTGPSRHMFREQEHRQSLRADVREVATTAVLPIHEERWGQMASLLWSLLCCYWPRRRLHKQRQRSTKDTVSSALRDILPFRQKNTVAAGRIHAPPTNSTTNQPPTR